MERVKSGACSKLLIALAERSIIQQSDMSVLENSYFEYTNLLLSKQYSMNLFYEGIVHISSVEVELSVKRVIEVNVESYQLLSVNGEDVRGIETNQVLDLNDEGERWEGDVLNDEPYGWGVLYDKEGEMAYEGFRIGNVNVCYGTQYYADIRKVEYEGEWCEGKRWGRGIQYDRNGVVVYDGEWVNDDQLEKMVGIIKDSYLLHSFLEELIVSDKSCNEGKWTVLDLSFISNLKVLQVGNECYEHVGVVKLVGLKKLEKVSIGWKCFTTKGYCWCMYRYGHFYVNDCERLKELKIGYRSFSNFNTCVIEKVPSLEVIELGELTEESANFYHASLELKSDGNGMK